MTTLDTIIKRLDECDEQRRNPPGALKAALLPAARQAAADLAALRLEHDAHAVLLDCARRDRDEARAEANTLHIELSNVRESYANSTRRHADLQRLLNDNTSDLPASVRNRVIPGSCVTDEAGRLLVSVAVERDALRAQLAEAADPDNRYRAMLDWRGVGVPCATCGGEGRIGYANTATWRGGGGGCAMTVDVCDACWGSGDAERPGVDLRELTRLGASLHKAAAAGYDRCTADVVAWLHTGGPALAFASTIGGSEYTCAADAITNGAHIGAKERA